MVLWCQCVNDFMVGILGILSQERGWLAKKV